MKTISYYFITAVTGVSLLTQGCVPQLPANLLNKHTPMAAPETFPDYGQKEEATDNPSKESTVSVKQDWHVFFKDPHLKSLITTALENNQELNILQQEIAIAKNEVKARRGEYLPRLGLDANYEYEKVGKHTSQGINDEQAEVPEKLHNRSAGLVSSWEVDIWSKLRNAAKSASYEYLASIEGRKFAITQLVAEIASTYYELLALDNQLQILTTYTDTLKRAQEVVELQQQAAKATSLAVKRFAAEVLKSQSLQYDIKQRIALTENRLNMLAGRLPQPVERASTMLIEVKFPPVAAGVPASLLENRPDIKKASLELEAAKLNVKSVKARFYPSLSIDAGLGYESFRAEHFFETPGSLFYNAAAGITAPLLNRMAIEADYLSANSSQVQAIYEYERTFLQAYADVANQLASIANLDKVYTLKTDQVHTLDDSLDIADTLFKAARIDYLEILLIQRDFLETRMEQVETKQKQLLAYTSLYRSLGGGWQQPETGQPIQAKGTKETAPQN